MADAERQSPTGESPGIEVWQRRVEKALKSRDIETLRSLTRDAIPLEPLYVRRSDTDPLPARNGKRWAIIQPVDDPDPDRANAQALEDLSGGADGLSLRFSGSPAAAGNGVPANERAFAAALDGVDLVKVRLGVEPSAEELRAARWLSALVANSGVAPELTKITFGLDPVAALSAEGGAAPDAKAFATCFAALRSEYFGGALALLDARPYHEAGASEAQELGGLLAVAAWWLRALAATGVEPADALPYFGASVSVDRDVLLSIAKLRALRLLWARLQELSDAPPTPLAVHAETSRSMLTRVDVPTNLLRNTVAAFAGAAGGADSITVLPHTAALGLADRGARTLATNIQHLLIEESHLHVVADPAAGSGALEALTESLAELAWTDFQSIEREGGIIESLLAGAFQSRIATARDALVNAVAAGAAPLVGATIHPPADAETPAAVVEEAAAVTGLEPMRLEEAVKRAAA